MDFVKGLQKHSESTVARSFQKATGLVLALLNKHVSGFAENLGVNPFVKNGFTLAVFEVPNEHCIIGDKQVMYQARRVKRSTRKVQCIMERLWTKKK